VLEGLARIQQYMDTEAAHPKTHLMTNIYVDETDAGTKLYFRIVAMLSGGKMGTASYDDLVVKTPDGWRVEHRIIRSRRG
jgi:hypothetical protein